MTSSAIELDTTHQVDRLRTTTHYHDIYESATSNNVQPDSLQRGRAANQFAVD
jgi:hypothetical protein